VSDKNIESVELTELEHTEGTRPVISAKPLDVVRDVKVSLVAVLGEAHMSVGELFNLKDNAVVKLDADVNQEVELLLDNQLVARGALVIADDNFGIQITEVMDAS